MASTLPLRERKKLRTHEQIVAAARRLFVENGYAATTTTAIAEAADVSPSTLFNYFDGKSDLLFAGYDEILDDFVAALRARDAGSTAIDAAAAWHADLRARLGADVETTAWHRAMRRIVDAEPALQAA